MPVVISIQDRKKTIQRTKDRFIKLAKRVGDLRPVWKDFIPEYQKIVKGAFDTKGKVMGSSWENYSDAYAKLRGRKTATLRFGNKMFNATQGGSGWLQKLGKHDLEMGISGEPYYAIHQYGNNARGMPQRAYFFTEDEDLPPRAWALLLKMTDNHIEREK